MAYKTLITHVCATQPDAGFLKSVAEMAVNYDAHLDAICYGIDQVTAGFYYGGMDPLLIQRSLQTALDDAEKISEEVRNILSTTNARWGVDKVANPLGTISHSVATRTRFCDLAILQSPYGENKNEQQEEAILEGALFGGQSPVLVLPEGVEANPEPETVLIGWNESAEAMNAVRAALPMLQKAKQVRVTVIDPPRHGSDRSDPGGPLSIFLARHGVKADIDVLGKSLPRVCDVLLRHAADKNADLIVMGAYGHSRFREAILGGATRDMLENATLPVFMMH